MTRSKEATGMMMPVNESFIRWISSKGSVGSLLALLLAGCAVTPHDEQLFSRNSPTAMQLTERRAQADWGCPQAKGSIVSQEIIQERRFHEVTVFTIKVEGCGKEALYITRCDDEKKTLCEATLQPGSGM